MQTLILLVATACFIWVSCSQNTDTISDETKTPINLSINCVTRANDSNFEAGDKVGVFVVNQPNVLGITGNHADNICFTYSTSWTPAEPIYWKDKTTKATFYAYYPYDPSLNSVTSYSFAIQDDQSNENNYWKSDFLCGTLADVEPTEDPVLVKTYHLFSNLLIYVKPGKGFSEETFATLSKSVKVNNVKTIANIALETCTATVNSGDTTTSITPWNTGDYYRAMVIPQTIAEGEAFVTVTIDGVSFTLKSPGATFVANKQHKVTVTVNKTNNGVDIGIGGWETGDGDFGGSAE